MYDKKFVSGVIVAAGRGERMGADRNKLLLTLGDRYILNYTIEAFEKNTYIDEIVVVSSKTDEKTIYEIAAEVCKKPFKVVFGGATRQQSSYNGLMATDERCDIVLIHDGARALVTDEIINSVVESAEIYGASAPGIIVTDTLKKTENGFIKETVNRENMVGIQTPQGFLRTLLRELHEKAKEDGFETTDDCMLAERYGNMVKVTEGSKENIKITTKDDLVLAEYILKTRKQGFK